MWKQHGSHTTSANHTKRAFVHNHLLLRLNDWLRDVCDCSQLRLTREGRFLGAVQVLPDDVAYVQSGSTRAWRSL
eukprot:COSAG01_NODE_50493_length_363_cov_0.575758_1_plen_74_part_01